MNHIKSYNNHIIEDGISIGGVNFRVFYSLMTRIKKVPNIIFVNPTYVNIIAEQLNITEKSARIAIKYFINANIIAQKDKNHYMLNPKYFWSGEHKDREKAIQDYSLIKTSNTNAFA